MQADIEVLHVGVFKYLKAKIILYGDSIEMAHDGQLGYKQYELNLIEYIFTDMI